MNATRAPRKNRAARGFTLLEMIATLMLATIAMNVGARLIQLTVRSYSDTADMSRVLKTQRQWLETLRRDAWSASGRSTADGTRLELSAADGHFVVWRQNGGLLVRDVANGESRSWPIGPRPLRWTTDRGVLTVSDDTSSIPLACPAVAAGGGS